MIKKRFVVCSGVVRSQSDGQMHNIGTRMITELYGVSHKACIIIANMKNIAEKMAGIATDSTLLILRPREDGRYVCPYATVPITEQTYALIKQCKEENWVPSDARCILADALQDAGYTDETTIAELQSQNEVDERSFHDAIYVVDTIKWIAGQENLTQQAKEAMYKKLQTYTMTGVKYDPSLLSNSGQNRLAANQDDELYNRRWRQLELKEPGE